MDKAQKLHHASIIHNHQNTFTFCQYNALSLCDIRSEYKNWRKLKLADLNTDGIDLGSFQVHTLPSPNPVLRVEKITGIRGYISCRDSIVSIATCCGLDNQRVGVRVLVGSRIFSTSSRPALGSTQPPIQWVPGALSPVVNRPGREADHSPPASAEVKEMWIYTSTPPYTFMA
jgi:hypothetical protein